MLDLAAGVSTGRAMPNEPRAHIAVGAVVLMSAEDGLADTVRPRLDAADADTTRVHHLDVYLNTNINSYRDQDVRCALALLAGLAERTGACIVLLRHLTKGSGGSQAMYRGGGSIGIIGAARAGLVAAYDPEDDSGVRRVLGVTKSNLYETQPALAYQLVGDVERACARVEWLGATSHTADQLVAPRQTDEERTALAEAVEWLEGLLTDGPVKHAEVRSLADAAGIAKNTLYRAQKRLGVVVERDDSTRGRPSTWRLGLVLV